MSLRVHHLDCATLCTLAPRLVGGLGLVCHCLVVETESGLVLVDTGLSLADVQAADERLGRGFVRLARPRLDPAQTARRQVEALGFSASDVRHIIVTHLDLDHAGGLADFPAAKVHVSLREHEAAMLSSSLRERMRYRAVQFAHWPDFELYHNANERWFGLESMQMRGLPPEIRLVPLFGHTRGHCGVAVQGEHGWMIHCGDAYFHHGTVEGTPIPPVLRLFQRLDDADHAARVENQRRLRALAASGQAKVFCAHDPTELERMRTG